MNVTRPQGGVVIDRSRKPILRLVGLLAIAALAAAACGGSSNSGSSGGTSGGGSATHEDPHTHPGPPDQSTLDTEHCEGERRLRDFTEWSAQVNLGAPLNTGR